MGIATFFGIVLCIYIILKPIWDRIENVTNLFDRRIKKLEDTVFYKKNHYSDE
mgnify:CR=1 FL=1